MLTKDLTVYTWMRSSEEKFENMSESIVVDPRNKTPEQLANDTKQKIEEIQPNKIGLRFWKEFNVPGLRYSFDRSNPAEFIKNGPFIDGVWQYWRDYIWHLVQLNISPDYFIHDFEDSPLYWNIPKGNQREDFFRSIFDDSDAMRKLPESVRNVQFEDFFNITNPETRIAINDYNDHIIDETADAIRRIFNRPMFPMFGKSIPHSNYADLNLTDVMYTDTNWRVRADSVTSRSSPIFYFDKPSEHFFKDYTKNPRWNFFIFQLNICRQCADNGIVVPWIAPPGYGRYGKNSWTRKEDMSKEIALWTAMHKHLFHMGIDTMILWNPDSSFWNPNAEMTDQFMDRFYETTKVNSRRLKNLPLIEYDAEEVITGDYVLKYDQVKDLY